MRFYEQFLIGILYIRGKLLKKMYQIMFYQPTLIKRVKIGISNNYNNMVDKNRSMIPYMFLSMIKISHWNDPEYLGIKCKYVWCWLYIFICSEYNLHNELSLTILFQWIFFLVIICNLVYFQILFYSVNYIISGFHFRG